MNIQNLEAINGLEINELSESYSFDDEGCACDNINDNPGMGW